MVKAGLIRRIRDLRDRRSVRLVITSNGKDILDRATVAGWELVQEVLSRLSEEEMRTLTRLLETVREKSFEYLNPGQAMEEIRRNESSNMARFMKRVARYGSSSAFATKEEDSQMPV
jgi:diphthamide synthase (EF-2-diphthine--ammonia ligase)